MKRVIQMFVAAAVLAATFVACGKDGTTVTVINDGDEVIGPVAYAAYDAGVQPDPNPYSPELFGETRVDVSIDAGTSATVRVPGPGCYLFLVYNGGSGAQIFLEDGQDLDWAP